MRRVAGVSPHTLPLRRRKRPRRAEASVHPTTFVAALTLSAVLVAAALYAGEQAARYLPGHIAVSSWQPPRAAHDASAPLPSQISNRDKKADREPVHMEARLAPTTLAPQSPAPTRPAPTEPGASAGGSALPETGRASWYDLATKTASGEDMDGDQLTAAHPTLALGSQVRVENLDNGRAVVVRINDRGPFAKDRIIDLSKAAAEQLGMIEDGVANVRVSPVAGEVASN